MKKMKDYITILETKFLSIYYMRIYREIWIYLTIPRVGDFGISLPKPRICIIEP